MGSHIRKQGVLLKLRKIIEQISCTSLTEESDFNNCGFDLKMFIWCLKNSSHIIWKKPKAYGKIIYRNFFS